ncbi:unnamed protein product [Oikopleura dioica]|uniref:Uncharacterized protein n=1 Tax=Oikopleura dioica TaxID=34765 RepID=E4WWQ2_OIKDI|nr:unnamed protein product [Oikopleura dioica]
MESAKTKVRNTEKENRELKAKNELLAAKMKQNNMDSNSVSDSASAFSLQNLSKRYEAELREKSRKEKELKTQIEQLQLEIKSQKKILEQEIGENFTSASSLLNGNWKGRQNQIMALQSRIKELERSKNQQNAVPGQLKELTKFHKDTLEKHKAEINSKDDQIKDLSQKLQQVKVRCQTLTNHQRVLKEHSLALEEKTKHDDELIEALSQRIKQIPAAVHSDEIPRGPTVKLESKETISEIKNLKEKIAILEQTVARKEEQMEQLHGACETLRNENERLQNSIVDGKVETKRQPIERDSLDLGAEDTVSNVQIQTLEREKQVAQQHLDECRKELSAFIERFDRTSSDELVADDLRSLRAVLQAQIQGRSSDTRRFQNLLEQNRLAFLEAIQLLQK